MARRLVFLLCLLSAVALRLAAQDEERILSFDSHITVHADGSMQVRETIVVQSAGVNIRHGIDREFPTSYTDKLGNNYTVGFEIIGVQRDGHAEPYHTADLSNGVRIYFGDAAHLLPDGKHTYIFTYSTSRQLGFFRDHDELYWNVTGNGWAFPIDVATATVVLPPPIRDSVKSLGGYTGYEKEKGQAFTASTDGENNPTFRAQDLLAKQGLSIVVTWPKGLMTEPTKKEKAQEFASDNRGLVAGLVGLLLVLVYYLVVWTMVGRDPPAGTIVPLYEPPDNMSPAAMRYLERMGFDMTGFTASIMDLAAKGYLTIDRDESQTYRLTRKYGYGEAEKKLSSDESLLACKLFETGDKLYLDKSNYAVLDRAKKALSLSLHGAMEKIDFVTNVPYLWPGIVLTFLTAVALIALSKSSQLPVVLFMTVWLTGWTLGVSVLLRAVVATWKQVFSGGLGSMGSALFLTLFSVPFLAGECFGIGVLYFGVGLPTMLVLFCAIGSNALFHHLLKAPTRAGRQLMDRVEGFKMFLKAVDGDRMRTMAPPNKTPELFERFLPHAVALGVEHAWAQQFTQVLAAASAGGQSSAGYSPSWYSGGGIAAFSAVGFASSFSSSFSSAVSSASAPASSSSGSSGGGSSGGGGGGGGGGGW